MRPRRPKRYAIGNNSYPGLGKLVEENGELTEVLGKVIGCGGMDHWTGDLTDRLLDECADVIAAIGFFAELNFSPEQVDRMAKRIEDKVDLFLKWHIEQGGKAHET